MIDERTLRKNFLHQVLLNNDTNTYRKNEYITYVYDNFE